MRNVSCTGRTDPFVHEAWLIVQNHLQRKSSRASAPKDPLTERWRSSPEFREYEERVAQIDFDSYEKFGKAGACIDVVRRAGTQRIEFSAGIECFLDSSTFTFVVTRNSRTHRLEIDEIRIEPQ